MHRLQYVRYQYKKWIVAWESMRERIHSCHFPWTHDMTSWYCAGRGDWSPHGRMGKPWTNCRCGWDVEFQNCWRWVGVVKWTYKVYELLTWLRTGRCVFVNNRLQASACIPAVTAVWVHEIEIARRRTVKSCFPICNLKQLNASKLVSTCTLARWICIYYVQEYVGG